jgi:hypothetical protein
MAGLATLGMVLYPPCVLPLVPGLGLAVPLKLGLGTGLSGHDAPSLSSPSLPGAGDGEECRIGDAPFETEPVWMANGEKLRSYVLGTAPDPSH